MKKLFIILFSLLLLGCFNSTETINTTNQVVSTSSNWLTTIPNFGIEKVPLANITSPTSIIVTTNKTDAQLEIEIQTALNKGGVIVFDTKGEKRIIKLTKQLYIPVQGKSNNNWNNDAPVVIDGGSFITLDGGRNQDGTGGTRIIEKAWKVNLTVQRMNFANADASNSTSGRADDGKSGGAINVENWDGSLNVIDCNFTNCNSKSSGPDIGGGAVRCPGQKFAVFYNCTFVNCSGSNGGAINSLGSELWLINCIFDSCKATGKGGGGEVGSKGQGGIGGAVYIDGISNNSEKAILRIENSIFRENSSNEFGGALFLYTYEKSGSKSLIKNTTFHNNKIEGTTGFGGAIYSQNGELSIISSTFDDNSSASMGGAVWHLSNDVARIANSTFSHNISSNFGSALQLNGPVYLSSCTVANNICLGKLGGAIRSSTPDKTWLKNCIVANNSCENSDIGNASETYQDGGGNYQWPSGITQIKAVSNINFTDPSLGELRNNGGFTFTRMPALYSKTIDGGTNENCTIIDQIGNTRIGVCDAGAVESK